MPRALDILKWVPAVVCGLLVVAWVVSVWRTITSDFYHGTSFTSVYVEDGTLAFYYRTMDPTNYWGYRTRYGQPNSQSMFGKTHFEPWRSEIGPSVHGVILQLPIPGLITLFLPLAIGPFFRFRFPLWSYFVFVAVIAGELAFYLAPYSGR